MISGKFIFNFTNFCVIVSFLTQWLALDILFSTAARAVVLAKLVILGIFFLTTFILTLRAVAVANSVTSGILFLTAFILALRLIWVAKLVTQGILS